MDVANTTDDAQAMWDQLATARENGEPQTAAMPPAKEEAASEPAKAEPQAQQAKKDDANTETAKQDDATAQAAAKDPVAELAEKFAKFEGQLRNIHGHIGGLTQGQNQLREKLLAASKQASAHTEGEAPTQAEAKEAVKDPEEWAALKAQYPEWAKATEAFFRANVAANQPPQGIDQTAIDKMVGERVAKETAAVREEAVNAHLDSIVDGDWRATVNSEDFGKWMAGQPDDVKSLGDSASLTDASKMLRLFVKSKQANPAQQILQQRSEKLDAAAGVPGSRRAQRSKSVDDMSPEELWAHYASQRDKQRG